MDSRQDPIRAMRLLLCPGQSNLGLASGNKGANRGISLFLEFSYVCYITACQLGWVMLEVLGQSTYFLTYFHTGNAKENSRIVFNKLSGFVTE